MAVKKHIFIEINNLVESGVQIKQALRKFNLTTKDLSKEQKIILDEAHAVSYIKGDIVDIYDEYKNILYY